MRFFFLSVLFASAVSPAAAADGSDLATGAGWIAAVFLAVAGAVIFRLWRREQRRCRDQATEIETLARRIEEERRHAGLRHQELAERLARRENALETLQQRYGDLDARHGALNGFLSRIPIGMWRRNGDLELNWVNDAYRHIVGQEGAEDIPPGKCKEITSPLHPDQARLLARRALEEDGAVSERRHYVVDGARRAFQITEIPFASGTAGYAIDITRYEELENDLQRHIDAHADVLEHLSSALAIFGPDKRLIFYNRSYADLWHLEESFLNTRPRITAVLDAMRENRRLPEQADFRAYKNAVLEKFTSVLEPEEELIQLPDETMLRVIVTPHPFGGLLYTYEDVTDQLVLERARNTLVAVQKATLDNLHEAVAVFSPDGRLRLFNSGYARLWQFDTEFLAGQPHVSDIVDTLIGRYNDDNTQLPAPDREQLIASATLREARNGRIQTADGQTIDYASVPLPDGMILFTYLDVSDSMRIERALRERAEALEAADQMKSEFIANVSYELRTPLNSIIGFTEILAGQFFGPLNEKQAEYSKAILDSSNQLLMLINDILDLASIEAGHLTLEKRPMEIGKVIDGVMALVRERALRRGIGLELAVTPGLPALIADETRIKQVLFNLVSNALKYTPEGGRIELGADKDGGWIRFWVHDNGVGIAPEHAERVFERFYRGNGNATERELRGAGLGLPLVRNFIELHGGHVELQSTPGEGTRVTCTLPLPEQAG